ncbi:hypothetical protein PEKONANI_02520 [Aeromonas jandaei]|uniref:hypothetical protein n=1 Tax=Aeromonas jandaei TaxID=650 RepID=UPI00366A763E
MDIHLAATRGKPAGCAAPSRMAKWPFLGSKNRRSAPFITNQQLAITAKNYRLQTNFRAIFAPAAPADPLFRSGFDPCHTAFINVRLLAVSPRLRS